MSIFFPVLKLRYHGRWILTKNLFFSVQIEETKINITKGLAVRG